MIVQLINGTIRIIEADDCHRLHLAARPGTDVGLVLRSTGFGQAVDEEKVLLDVGRLHSAAEAAASGASWESGWTAMIEYAGTQGWLSSDGRSVAAHVEYSGDE